MGRCDPACQPVRFALKGSLSPVGQGDVNPSGGSEIQAETPLRRSNKAKNGYRRDRLATPKFSRAESRGGRHGRKGIRGSGFTGCRTRREVSNFRHELPSGMHVRGFGRVRAAAGGSGGGGQTGASKWRRTTVIPADLLDDPHVREELGGERIHRALDCQVVRHPAIPDAAAGGRRPSARCPPGCRWTARILPSSWDF